MEVLELAEEVIDTEFKGETNRAEVPELRSRTRLSEKGRLVIPAAMRKALEMDAGDVLELCIVNGELCITTLRSRIRRVQERASRFVQPGTLVSDELSAERREAAKNE
jgi:AbrB family looped-hinge helix DNA binding protein